MAKIYGDADSIKKAQEAPSGAKNVYVNLEAIAELPEKYEAVIQTVKFNSKNLSEDFTNVGTKDNPTYYPQTSLMYRIAEACGISGTNGSDVEPLIEVVDINPLLMKSIEDDPVLRKKTVGRLVAKQSVRLMEDGTLRLSSSCTAEYNAWERCCASWSKEESTTNGYEKLKSDAKGLFIDKVWNNKPYKTYMKYDTRFKRQADFDNEMKFAHAKAETKAHLKTVRELAGLPTGFSPEDLKDGELIFVKIRESQKYSKMKVAAELDHIRNHGSVSQASEKALFGKKEPLEIEENILQNVEEADFSTPESKEPGELSKEELLVSVFEEYLKTCKDEEEITVIKKEIDYLTKNPNSSKNPSKVKWFLKAANHLNVFEEKVPEQFRVKHPDFIAGIGENND